MEAKTLSALHWILDILEKYQITYCISWWLSAHLYGADRPVNDIDIDIPESIFDIIISDIRPYIIFWPALYTDKKRKLLLATLNYHWQEIDLSWAENIYLYNEITNSWIHKPTDFTRSLKLLIDDRTVSVNHPQDLISYKSLLHWEHQLTDIEAVNHYISQYTITS